MNFKDLSNHYFKEGLMSLENNSYTDGIKKLEKAIKFNDKNYEIFNVLGLAYYKLGNFLKAKIMWEKSIKLNPNDDAFLYLKHINSKEFKEISKVFNKALSLANKGKYKNAIKILKTIPYGENIKFLNLFGLLKYSLRKRKKALKTWQRVLTLDKSNKEAINYLTKAYKERKSFNIFNWLKGL